MNSYNGFSGRQRQASLRAMHRDLASGAAMPPQGPCQLCGDPDVAVEYHSEDYSEPFSYTPPATYALCRHCHRSRLHKRFENPLGWETFKAHVRRGGYARDTRLHRVKKELSRYQKALEAGERLSLERLRERAPDGDDWWEVLSTVPVEAEAPATLRTPRNPSEGERQVTPASSHDKESRGKVAVAGSELRPRAPEQGPRAAGGIGLLPTEPKTEAMEWRNDGEAARQVLERLYPEPEVRATCEQVLADAIRCAARAPRANWSVTLNKDFIRLNTGSVEALAFKRQSVLMVVDQEVVPRPQGNPIFRVNDATYTKATVLHWSADVSPRDLSAALQQAGRGLMSYITANTQHRCPYRSSHSPGVLHYLNLEIEGQE